MKNGAGIQKFTREFAFFRRALHRREQGCQRATILRPRIFLQSASQWNMLRVSLLRKAMGVGGTVEEDAIVLQGDLRTRLASWLSEKGVVKVTVSG